MAIHKLKILPKYFNEVLEENKRFEIRKDDRGFEVGDYLMLQEFDGKKYLDRHYTIEIKYILKDAEKYGLKDGYVILSF